MNEDWSALVTQVNVPDQNWQIYSSKNSTTSSYGLSSQWPLYIVPPKKSNYKTAGDCHRTGFSLDVTKPAVPKHFLYMAFLHHKIYNI